MDVKTETADCNFAYAIITNLHGSSNEKFRIDHLKQLAETSHDVHNYNLMSIKSEEIDIKDEELSVDANEEMQTNIPTPAAQKLSACRFCQYKTPYAYNLKEHVKVHLRAKPFDCSICGFKTANKHYLIYHVNRHAREKPYSCSICNFRTPNKPNLDRHVLNKHNGDKPYVCSICKFRTARKQSLIGHMKCHVGEKPFACGICKFRTASKYGFVRHMNTHLRA